VKIEKQNCEECIIYCFEYQTNQNYLKKIEVHTRSKRDDRCPIYIAMRFQRDLTLVAVIVMQGINAFVQAWPRFPDLGVFLDSILL